MACADATAHQCRTMLRKLPPPRLLVIRKKVGKKRKEKICKKEINYFLFLKLY
jgi:hypothetical protein